MELMKGSDPLSDFIEAGGQLFELDIEPAWQAGVRANLQVISDKPSYSWRLNYPTTPSRRRFSRPVADNAGVVRINNG